MANFFQQLFGGGKKQEAPAILSPIQTPEGANLKKQLEDLIAQRGFGYTPSQISAFTSPYAAQRQASLKESELPLISAQASSRGLGRSTIPVSMSAGAGQAASRDIEERVAQMTKSSEDLKAQQYANALSQYGGLVGDITSAENAKRAAAMQAQNTNAQTYNKMMQNVGVFGANSIGGLLSAAAPMLGGIPVIGGGLQALAQGLGGTASSLGGTMGGSTGNAALVKMSDNDLMAKLMELLGGNKGQSTRLEQVANTMGWPGGR